jgi:CBS domain-containing protein
MTLQEAAKKMREQDFGFLPIGENDRLIGTITDRDIVIRGVAEASGHFA